MRLGQVSILRHFCLFFKLCCWCFHNTPSGYFGIRAPRASPVFSITIYIGERKLALYVRATTHGPTSVSC